MALPPMGVAVITPVAVARTGEGVDWELPDVAREAVAAAEADTVPVPVGDWRGVAVRVPAVLGLEVGVEAEEGVAAALALGVAGPVGVGVVDAALGEGVERVLPVAAALGDPVPVPPALADTDTVERAVGVGVSEALDVELMEGARDRDARAELDTVTAEVAVPEGVKGALGRGEALASAEAVPLPPLGVTSAVEDRDGEAEAEVEGEEKGEVVGEGVPRALAVVVASVLPLAVPAARLAVTLLDPPRPTVALPTREAEGMVEAEMLGVPACSEGEGVALVHVVAVPPPLTLAEAVGVVAAEGVALALRVAPVGREGVGCGEGVLLDVGVPDLMGLEELTSVPVGVAAEDKLTVVWVVAVVVSVAVVLRVGRVLVLPEARGVGDGDVLAEGVVVGSGVVDTVRVAVACAVVGGEGVALGERVPAPPAAAVSVPNGLDVCSVLAVADMDTMEVVEGEVLRRGVEEVEVERRGEAEAEMQEEGERVTRGEGVVVRVTERVTVPVAEGSSSEALGEGDWDGSLVALTVAEALGLALARAPVPVAQALAETLPVREDARVALTVAEGEGVPLGMAEAVPGRAVEVARAAVGEADSEAAPLAVLTGGEGEAEAVLPGALPEGEADGVESSGVNEPFKEAAGVELREAGALALPPLPEVPVGVWEGETVLEGSATVAVAPSPPEGLAAPLLVTLGLLLPVLVMEGVRRGEPVPLLRRVALPVTAPALCDGADWERLADAVVLTVVVVEGH